MKKEFLMIDGKKLSAKNGCIQLDGKDVSKKDETLISYKVDDTILENIQAIENMLSFKTLKVKRGSSAKFGHDSHKL